MEPAGLVGWPPAVVGGIVAAAEVSRPPTAFTLLPPVEPSHAARHPGYR